MIKGWPKSESLAVRDFTCGHCGRFVASEKGLNAVGEGGEVAHLYICPKCQKVTFFDIGGVQIPGSAFGSVVEGIDKKDVEDLYEEARQCTSANAFTAAILCCRKLLMHIAVSKGASEGLKFIEYVEYLAENNYIPPDAKDWVDHIRDKGNEANHEITIMTKTEAEELLSFMEMLLKVIYEFPARIKKKTTPPTSETSPNP